MRLAQMHDERKIIATLKFHGRLTLTKATPQTIPFGPYIIRIMSTQLMTITAFQTTKYTFTYSTTHLEQSIENQKKINRVPKSNQTFRFFQIYLLPRELKPFFSPLIGQYQPQMNNMNARKKLMNKNKNPLKRVGFWMTLYRYSVKFEHNSKITKLCLCTRCSPHNR